MGHIVQGDTRQYLSSGAALQDSTGNMFGLLGQGLEAGISITEKANASTLANNQIDLSTKFLAKNNEINTKYQADPTNPQREIELQQAFESLASEYKINPVCQKQWSEIKNTVYNRYKEHNTQWAEKQQQSNISTNLKNGYENLINQVSMLGENGGSIDDMRLIYANGIEGLRNGAVAGLGEVTVNEFLKDSNHDIMATYISALAMNNPLEAQKLLNDEGVRNDIGRAETLEKLESYVSNSLLNQSKKAAVSELGNTLRAMNSDDAKNILEGRADLTKVMKFVETNKALPEGSKELVLGIYGIGTKSDYYYDRDKKIITKSPEGGSGRRSSGSGNLVALKKLSKTQKEEMAMDLESRLYDMFSFDPIETVNPKEAIKSGSAMGMQSGIVNMMKNVAQAQGAIDTAYNAGIINKSQRKNLMDKFIEPMTDYLGNSMENLDEKQNFFGAKLGYDKLKKEFSIEGIPASHKNEIKNRKKMLLAAQGAYYNALDTARQANNLDSIYDIETELSPEKQKIIYKKASEEAINYAKKYGEHPEIFFKQEYPALYSQGVAMFGIKDADKIANQVAKEIYSADADKKPDVREVMSKAVTNMYAVKKDKAAMTRVKLYEKYHVMPEPKMIRTDLGYVKPKGYDERMKQYKENELQRMKALGISESDLNDTVKANGLSRSQVLSMLELQKFKQKSGKDFSIVDYD